MIDVYVAEKYLKKIANAKLAKHEFQLTFNEYKRLITRKHCYYTGIELTSKRAGANILQTDCTLDRIDNTKGYVNGNVVACCHAFNKLKSTFENPCSLLTIKNALKGLKIADKLEK